MDNDRVYGERYYEGHLGSNYSRNNGWEEVFGKIADRIVRELQPNTVLDAGCAFGYLVEALRDRGVDAYGIDISEYAISQVREDVRPYCKVASITKPLEKKYDLIICIEVFEHLEKEEIISACKNLSNHTKDILFSSTPFDYHEESHINVKPIEYWVEQFSYEGYYHEIEYDTSYIAIQAIRLRKGEKDKAQLIRNYEHNLFCLRQELIALRDNFNLSQERIRVMELNDIKKDQEIVDIKNNHSKKISNIEEEIRQENEGYKARFEARIESLVNEIQNMDELNISIKDQIDFLRKEIMNYDKQSLILQERISDLESSTSWLITRPIRFLGKTIKRIKG